MSDSDFNSIPNIFMSMCVIHVASCSVIYRGAQGGAVENKVKVCFGLRWYRSDHLHKSAPIKTVFICLLMNLWSSSGGRQVDYGVALKLVSCVSFFQKLDY